MKLKKSNYLILTVTIFFVVSSITILSSNNKIQKQDKLVIREENSDLVKDNYKSNLVIESDDNNIVTTGEEEEGNIRVSPENEGEAIKVIPNPNSDEEVILKRLWDWSKLALMLAFIYITIISIATFYFKYKSIMI